MIESTLQVESGTMDSSFLSQYWFIRTMIDNPVYCRPTMERLTVYHSERLKQLVMSYDSAKATELPAVWMCVNEILLKPKEMARENIQLVLRTVLDSDADVNARFYGIPSFHLVSYGGKSEHNDQQYHNMVELATALLENGLEPFALSDGGLSTFDIAERYGWTSELSLVLRRAGYDPDEVACKIKLAQ